MKKQEKQKRLNRAKVLLKRGNLSKKEIAAKLRLKESEI